MKLLLLLTIGIAFAAACGSPKPPDKAPDSDTDTQTAAKKPLTYLALGDSYTIGESVAQEERWPVQLAGMLRDTGIAIDDPTIIAKTGWTTGELESGIAAADVSAPYDMVSLLIGVNNQYRGMDISIFVHEFKELLDMATGFAGKQPGPCFRGVHSRLGRHPLCRREGPGTDRR